MEKNCDSQRVLEEKRGYSMAVFRVEKTKNYTVMSNHHLRSKTLSLKAKGLMSLMLSLPEDWDYTTRGLAAISKEGVDAIGATLKELENHGYLTRRRLRDAHGRVGDIEYTIHEQPITDTISPKRDFPDQVLPIQDKPKQDEPEQENPSQLNTESSNTKNNQIQKEISIHPSIKPEQAENTVSGYRELIMDNIEYSCLVERYGEERMDEIIELILETVLSKKEYIRVAGSEFPQETVKSRFLKLNSCHIEYVFQCMDENTTKIYNIKAYLLTALYNTAATMDSYYRAEVQHDLCTGLPPLDRT